MCVSSHLGTTEIYTLSLHDALPIFQQRFVLDRPHPVADAVGPQRAETVADLRRSAQFAPVRHGGEPGVPGDLEGPREVRGPDRKSTRLNSSHSSISYAVFCLKKKTS